MQTQLLVLTVMVHLVHLLVVVEEVLAATLLILLVVKVDEALMLV